MIQTLRKRFPVLILCAVLLAALCGCQEQSEYQDQNLFPDFPLSSESIASMEAMYGKTLEEVGEEWGFSEEELTERLKGIWYLKKPAVIREKQFTQSLRTHLSSDTFYSLEYICHCASAEETADLAEALYADLVEAYGEPIHDEESGVNYLYREGAFDAIRNPEDDKFHARYGQWENIGEFSQFTMNINTWQAQEIYTILLTYRVYRDE